MWIAAALLATLVVAALAARAALDRRVHAGPPSDHFDGERFFNPAAQPTSGFGAFLRWRLSGERAEWPPALPVAQARHAPRVEGDAMVVTAVGHASVLVQTAGLNILTDPVWSERVSPFASVGPKRVRAPGIAFDDLPRIDLVLVSHNHYDHLDLATLDRLWRRDRPMIVTPLGNDALLARRGIKAVARDWGGSVAVNDAVSVTVERVQHWSSRWGVDRNRALWGGFTVATPGGSIYFAGDCGYSDAFREAAAARGPYRLALIPVGAYEPRWFMKYQHMDPTEAVATFRDLRASHAVGIHWGVWQLTDEPIDAPRAALATALRDAALPPTRFRAMEPGESWTVPANPG
jgi:L-ascorbate metabolism protein UlaG (beta-lactamase superfamily)